VCMNSPPIHQNVKCVWIVIRLCFWKPVITFAILFVNTSNMKLHIHYWVKNVVYTEKKTTIKNWCMVTFKQFSLMKYQPRHICFWHHGISSLETESRALLSDYEVRNQNSDILHQILSTTQSTHSVVVFP